MPQAIGRTPGLGPDVVLRQDAPGGEQQRELAVGTLLGGHERGEHELALAPYEVVHVHDRRAFRVLVVAGPLHAAQRVDLVEAHALEGRRGARDLVHDLGRMAVVHVVTQRLRQHLGDLPVRIAGRRGLDLAHPVDAPLGVGERAVLFQEGRPRQEDMGVARRLVQENVLDDHTVHRGETRGDMLDVGVGLENVLALHIQALEGTRRGRVDHVGNTQTRLLADGHAPFLLEDVAHALVGNVAIARQLVRERAHVAGALHVVLAAQRIHAHARPADVAGGHGDIRHAHDHGRPLAVLGHAEPVVDGAIAARGVEPCRFAHHGRRHAGVLLGVLRAVFVAQDEIPPAVVLVQVAALFDERPVFEALAEYGMRHGVHERHVRTGPELQMVVGFDMR